MRSSSKSRVMRSCAPTSSALTHNADLGQAIAEKCSGYLRTHKTVVTSAEVEQIVKDMGPVDGGEGIEQPTGSAPPADAPARNAAAAPKRLYQIREGAELSGVCMGLAAYFNVDVTIVRILFVLVALLTSGGWLLAYIVMMLVIPVAKTTEERAAAAGVAPCVVLRRGWPRTVLVCGLGRCAAPRPGGICAVVWL